MPTHLDIAAGSGEVRTLWRAGEIVPSPYARPEQWPSLLKTTYSMVLDARVAMYIAWGPELRMFYNDAYMQILGRHHPAALGAPLWQVWPELQEGFLPVINAALAGTPTYFENTELTLYRHGQKEVAWFTLSISPIRDEDGAVPGVWVTVLETTEQILFERRRTEELQFLTSLFQEAPGFIAIVTGPEHVFTLANKAYLRIAGGRDLLGKPFRLALPGLDGQNFYELLDQVYATRQAHVAHGQLVKLARPGGDAVDAFFVDFVFQPIFEANGAISGIFIEGSDVTEQYRAQHELERKIVQLNEADQRKDEFLAMLAHELRNPLAPISAAAELLQRASLDETRVRQTSQIIGRQVRHMTSLVDDLLDVARVTKGQVALDQLPQDVGQLVADAVEQVTPLIRSRRHRLDLQLASDAASVVGDHKRLVQVLANILNNAAKYTHEGGTILVTTAVRGPAIVIEIVDDGIGMTQDFAAQAFDLFAQAARTSDRLMGGLGLGLALVKKLVELHGGTISAESAGLGQGSRITVTLPRRVTAAPDSAAPDAPRIPWDQAASPLRILVVDDNADAASMLALLLEASGHEVLVESGAHQGLARARSARPQVCLLDIGLPDMDGNVLAQQLRALPGTAHCVLVAVTGYGQESDRRQSMAAGFDHHLVKPVDIGQVLAILDTVPRL
jgi:signal transduction histidine kinase/CheY-like chemotaxis protein